MSSNELEKENFLYISKGINRKFSILDLSEDILLNKVDFGFFVYLVKNPHFWCDSAHILTMNCKKWLTKMVLSATCKN